MGVAVLAGTRKGLFVLRSDESRRAWSLDGPLLRGWSVYHAIRDPRDGRLHACTNHPVYGATVHRSDDLGERWERAETMQLPEGFALECAWHIEPGTATEPGRLWLGGAPGLLLRSNDGGASWQAVASVLEHPTRAQWHPGAGGLCCHSIQIDPTDPQRMTIGISAAGVFTSGDGGVSWSPANAGTAADFLPDPYPEVGQCVHKVLLHSARPERLWQQNHCGVYRSDDRGQTWERLDGNGLPSAFGFPIALDPRAPDTAWVASMESPEYRVVSGGRLGVYRTSDGGESWDLSAQGLPAQAWTVVWREGMASDALEPTGLYLGTQSGSVFVSADGGASWSEPARQLPPVLSVEVCAWP